MLLHRRLQRNAVGEGASGKARPARDEVAVRAQQPRRTLSPVGAAYSGGTLIYGAARGDCCRRATVRAIAPGWRSRLRKRPRVSPIAGTAARAICPTLRGRSETTRSRACCRSCAALTASATLRCDYDIGMIGGDPLQSAKHIAFDRKRAAVRARDAGRRLPPRQSHVQRQLEIRTLEQTAYRGECVTPSPLHAFGSAGVRAVRAR